MAPKTSTPRTSFQGWHVRAYKEAEGRDGVAFSASIYKGDQHAGDIRNSGSGGPDSLHILPAFQAEWNTLAAAYEAVPNYRNCDSNAASSLDNAFAHFLMNLWESDRVMTRNRRAGIVSGVAGYRWAKSFGSISGEWEVVGWKTATVPVQKIPTDLVRYVFTGQDNTVIHRHEPVPDDAPASQE